MTGRHWNHTLVNRLLGGAVTHLRIGGVIDETFDAKTLSAEMRGHVLLDVGQVERLSSFGVRKWMEFTKAVPLSVSKLYLLHLPPFFVDQLNMVDGFAGVAEVISVLAPYTCTHCGEGRVRVIDIREEREAIAAARAPAHACPVCDRPLEFADQPEEFFDYVRQLNPAPIEPVVERYLTMLKPTQVTGYKGNVKVVEGDVTFLRLPAEITKDLNVRRLAGSLEGRVLYDFSAVHSVAQDALPRLSQMLDAAAASAHVMLWRVPPNVLPALAALPQSTWKIATLNLPGECCNCGQKVPQRVSLSRFVEIQEGGEELLLDCPICGGLALLPKLREQLEFLKSVCINAEEGFEEFGNIESRALSQYFNQSSAGSASGSGPGATSGPHSATQLSPQGNDSGQKFQIIKRLGQGGMAEVYLAKQAGMQGFEKYLVIKKVLENFANSPEFVDMLFAEARANARLNHPNVVSTYDVGMMNGTAYIAMEYVRGPDGKKILHALRKAKRMMPVDIALRIIADTAAGLHYAHSYVDPAGNPHPMVHRDVSPHNILVSLDGVIKLSDFGIAKVEGEGDSTRAGTFKGKIHYVSPEAIALQPLDGRNDVFGLGVSLFELLTGKLPFKRDSEAASLHAIVYDAPPDPASLNPKIPPEVSHLIYKALEKDRNKRTSTAGQMRDDIERVMIKLGMATTNANTVAQFVNQLFPGEFGPESAAATSGPLPQPTPVPKPRTAATPRPPSISDMPPPPTAAGRPPRPPPEAMVEAQVEMATAVLSRGSGTGRAPSSPAVTSQTPSAARALGAQQPVRSNPNAPAARPPQAQVPAQPPPTLRSAPPGASSPTLPAGGNNHQVAAAHSVRRNPVAPPQTASVPRSMPAPAVAPPQTAAAPAPSGKRKAFLAAGAAGVLLLAGVGYSVTAGGEETVQVLNLQSGEALFVAGRRVDPSKVPSHGRAPQIVAVARSGQLVRLGNATVDTRLDVQSLVAVTGEYDARPENMGKVTVITDPPGCIVSVDTEQQPTRSPANLDVAPGKLQRLEIACPGRALYAEEILAAPGQVIQVVLAR